MEIGRNGYKKTLFIHDWLDGYRDSMTDRRASVRDVSSLFELEMGGGLVSECEQPDPEFSGARPHLWKFFRFFVTY
jgi:hypothetical protein